MTRMWMRSASSWESNEPRCSSDASDNVFHEAGIGACSRVHGGRIATPRLLATCSGGLPKQARGTAAAYPVSRSTGMPVREDS